MKKNRILPLLTTGALAFGSLMGCQVKKEAPAKPNLIYIFPDQWRKQALGFWEEPQFKGAIRTKADPVQTPHLDQFAREGVVFSQMVSTQPLCSPYRGMLFTAKMPHRNGVPLNCRGDRPFSHLDSATVCFSDVLKKNGYDLAYFGKWHLTYYDLFKKTEFEGETYGKIIDKKYRHGFDRFYKWIGGPHTAQVYHDENEKIDAPGKYGPENEVDQVISYLENRDASKPFSVMVAMNPPHNPYYGPKDARPEDLALYKDKPMEELLYRPNADLTMEKTACAPYYFANVTSIDREFGRLMDYLDKKGLKENTIVVFTSDHGETMCSQGTKDPKNSPYSEAFDIPFLLRYPKKLKASVNDMMMGTCDIMPTLMGLMGLDEVFPDDVDGVDYSKTLLGEKGGPEKPQSALYVMNVNGEMDENGKAIDYLANRRGVKTDRYTFAIEVEKEGKIVKTFLYDNQEDPYQQINIPFEEKPQLVKELGKALGAQLKKYDDPWYQNHIASSIVSY